MVGDKILARTSGSIGLSDLMDEESSVSSNSDTAAPLSRIPHNTWSLIFPRTKQPSEEVTIRLLTIHGIDYVEDEQ